MSTDKIQAVFFDWDMTLARTVGDVAPAQRLALLFEREGLHYSPLEVGEAIEKHYLNGGAGTRGKSLQTPAEIMHFYGRILHHLGKDSLESGLIRRLYDGYAYLPTLLYDDTLPILQALHTLGLQVGIITNHSRTARQGIEQLVGHLVPSGAIVISEEQGHHKPDPIIYATAAAGVGVSPADCMMVGDNFQVDAVGAVVHGGFACGVWLDRKLRHDGRSLPTAVTQITTLAALLPMLQRQADA